MASPTVVVDLDGKITCVIVTQDGPGVHLVREHDAGPDSYQEEAVLLYDEARDPVVPGYGRSKHTVYGPDFAFASDLMYVRETAPEQPERKD